MRVLFAYTAVVSALLILAAVIVSSYRPRVLRKGESQ